MKTNKKNIKSRLIVLVCFVVILPVAWILVVRLEGEKPSITLELPSPSIGKTQELTISVSDAKSGVRRIWIGLVKDGKEVVLFEKDLPFAGLIRGGFIHQESFKIVIEPVKMGITDGKAILRMVARDYSWRRWLHGNTAYLEKDVMIDTRPPEVDILSRAHNVSQGGAGLVIYRVSETCPKSGVFVGRNFFPGYPGYFKDNNILIAFFALDYKQGPGTKIFVNATDLAGNSSRAGFPYYIKRKVFKKDLIEISDRFLNWKMPEFDVDISPDSKTPLVDKFLKVNREVRQDNYNQLLSIVGNTDKKLYWKGTFLRLPKSARKAGFADHRRYKYKGHIIDRQIHMGVDLASVAHAPVSASNTGKVAFAEYMGIYGKTVIIDHGFGLFSMYSHLSDFNVKKGQIVSKGEIIGRTGTTGLAGGDHLHFGMLVNKTFVNPVEWWDASWIKNNISGKINTVKPNNR
ncbi:MAG: M23 family metallopeptidase [Thermodesulfobacteriota bacterium]|nr:M23 family metallopeptidase [Thermodesulfobacteriota bacterium]